MLATVGYEQQIHSRIDCFRSLDVGVSALIRVTECWLSPLGYTIQDLIKKGDYHLFGVGYPFNAVDT